MKRILSVILAFTLLFTSTAFAAPAVVTIADSAADISVLYEEEEIAVDENTAELYEDTWYDIEKGTLLFNMDFDSDNSGNAVSSSAYDGISLGSYSAGAGELVSGLGRLNPDVQGSYDVGFRYTTSGSATLGDEAGNKYLSVNSSGSNQISLYLGNTFTKAGTYVFEYDYKLVSTGATTPKWIDYNTPSNGSDTSYTFNEWKFNSTTYTLSGASNAARVIFYGNGNYSVSDALYLDNIKVWYYDESVDYDSICNPEIEINDVWEDEEKGTKLFTIDFTAKNDKKALDSSSWDSLYNRLDNYPASGELISDIGRVNPAVDGSNYRISVNYIDNSKTELVTEEGNTYLSLAPVNTNGDVSLYLGGFYGEEGTYTIETSYKFVQTGANGVAKIRYETLGLEYTDASYLSTGNWVDLSEVHEHSSCSHGNVNRTRFNTESYGTTPFSADDRIYIDNIAVYYKAPEVDEPDTPEVPEINDVWEDEQKGTKLFTVDFTAKNDGTAIDSSSWDVLLNRLDNYPSSGELISDIGRINPDVDGSNYRISFNYIDNSKTELVTEEGNTYLSLAPVNTNGDVSLYLGGFYGDEGTYTIETSYKFVQTGANGVAKIRYETLGLEYRDASYLSTGNWVDLSEVHEHSSCSHGNVNRTRFNTEDYGNTPYSANDRIYIDNISVYYKAPVVDEPQEPETNEWIDAELGERLFVIDLDGDTKYQTADLSKLANRIDGTNDNSDANGLYLSEIGRVNPDYEEEYAGVFKYSFKDGGTPSVNGDADKYFTHTASTGPSVMVANPFVGEGTYTVVFNHDSAKSFTVHSGYTGGEIATTAVDSAWSQTAYSVEISAQGGNDYFRIIGSNGAGTYLVDDVALYYRSPDFVPPTDGGDDEEDDSEWKDAEKGTLLYEVDFETKNDGSALTSSDYSSITSGRLDNAPDTAGVAVSAIGRVNPEYSNNFRLNFKDAGTSSLAGTDNKYIVQTVGSAMSVFTSNTFVDAGVYTFEFDYNTASGTGFYAHSGYTGGTYSSEVIDDTWTHVTYVVEAYDASYMRFLSNAASAQGKFMYDNFKVYFRQTTKDVTVMANGNSNVSDTVVAVDAENGAAIGTIISNVDISASTKYLLGASLTADGELLAADYVVMPSEVTTLYLIWGGDIVVDEDPWHEDGLGTLLFNVNWDGTLSNNEQTRWADVRAAGASTNSEWKNFEKMYFMWGSEDIGGTTWVPAKSPLIVAEANGNRYYTQPHDGTYNGWSLYSTFGGDWAGWADGDGVFTITYKVKTVGNITPNNLFVDTNLVYNHTQTRQDIRHIYPSIPDSNGWLTVTIQFDTSEYTTNVGETLGQTIFYVQTNESSAVNGAYICYDDIQVYYKPSTVNVTMKPGTNLEVNETVVEASTKGILVSELIALVDTQDTALLATGIVTEDGSKKYALTDTVVLDSDTTFVITWEENEWLDDKLGMLIQRADFEGTLQTTTVNRWPAATALGAAINPEYAFEGVTGLQFTVSETGIAFDSNMLWIPADYDVTENGNTYFEIPTSNIAYGSQQYTSISMYAMGKGASQYQYQGAGTYTITGKIKYGTDIQNAAIELRPNLYNGSGLTGGYNYRFEDTVAGEWNDFSVTWSTAEDSEYGLGSVYFYLFYDALSTASTIAYDDIMLYYKPFTATVTLRSNGNDYVEDMVIENVPTNGVAVQELIKDIKTPYGGKELVGLAYDKAGTNMLEDTVLIGCDSRFFMIWKDLEQDENAPWIDRASVTAVRTDDPVGLVFEAYMSQQVAASCSSYGWVATRKTIIDSFGLSLYDMTFDSEFANKLIKVENYNGEKQIGCEIKDSMLYMTSVFYGITEEMYNDVIVARPYTVVDGTYHYGEPVEASVYSMAKKAEQNGFLGLSGDTKAFFKRVIHIVEK